MRNLSSRWKEKVNSGMDVQYLKYADITLKDGTILHLTNADLWQNGMTFEDSVSSDSSFDIGSAIVNALTLSINNFDEKYSKYDFEGAEVVCYIGLQLEPEDTSSLLDTTGEIITDTNGQEITVHKNALIEKIRICTMTVAEQPEDETITIDLTCEDNMRKFDRNYSDSKLIYPATRKQIVQDACEVCGVTLQTQSFDHDDYIVQTRPDDDVLTFRQVLQWVAQIGCQWLRCDEYGRLCIKWYDTEKADVQEISSTYSFTPQHTDVVITGIKVTEYTDSSDEEAESYMSGANGYVLGISGNKLIRKGDGQTVTSIIAEKCVGMVFRPFESETLTDVALEAGDAITIEDRNGKLYSTYITSTTLQPGSGQRISCGAETAAKNSSAQYSQVTQAYVTARKMIKAEKTAREKALEEFGKRMDSATGVYTTVETQEDGSQIFYLHDKPTLAESKAVWKMTSEAWGVSTDGGKTWNGGMTVDGDTIVRILNAVGVNAEWINAGAITVKDNNGNIIFQVDMDARSVIMSGDHVQIGGKTATKAISDSLAESKAYSDGKLADYANTVTNSLSGLQAQIDGQIESFFYDYEPSLQNEPASEWTSTEERKKHEGDLFYWKSTGYAYRFMQDGATWKWQLIQDNDISKALAAAETAQDTADGKRRTFVVQPSPPYDIGDLWSQDGGDILTCVVARAKGSVYASSDWKKLNKYTDDTTANKALEAAALAKNMTLQLSNDMQTITADNDGNIPTFPTVSTKATVMYGSSDITNDCSYTITKSDSITGSWSDATHIYNVTGLSADNGWVDIRATYLSNLSVTKRFTVSKVKTGAQGIPGAGKDGKTTYLHIRYAPVQNPSANQISTTPNEYIGTYTDFTAADSTDPTKYTWAKFKGDQGVKGDPGYTPVKGVDYFDGEDGTSSYLWVRYAKDANGTGMTASPTAETTYIGTASTTEPTAPTSASAYKWSKYVGTDGINGKNGYIHIAYADSADGKTGFDTSVGTNKKYIGQYTDNVQADSTDPTKYTWTLIKGADGKSSYTWIKYASRPDGLDMSDNPDYVKLLDSAGNPILDSAGEQIYTPEQAIYMGVASNKDTAVESDNPADYTWSRFRGVDGRDGSDGLPGIPGEDGRTPYVHFAYANSEDGKTDFSVSDSTNKIYIGQYTDYTVPDSTDPTKYAWTKIKGDDGAPGRTYRVEPSCNVLKRGADKVISPNFLEFKAYYQDGDEAERHPYSGRFVIEETVDGETWTTMYTSSSDENTVRHYLYTILTDGTGQSVTDGNGTTVGIPRDVTNIRCRLYQSGETVNQYDMQSVAVVVDVDKLTAEDIVNTLSGDGAEKKIYIENGHVYISCDALLGGTVILGGKNNGNGILKILNSEGKISGKISNGGQIFYDYEEKASIIIKEESMYILSKRVKLNSEKQDVYGTRYTGGGLSTFIGTIYEDSFNNVFFQESVIRIPIEDEDGSITEVDPVAIRINEATEDYEAWANFEYLQVYNHSSFWGSVYFGDLTARSSAIPLGSYLGVLYQIASSSKRYKDIGDNISEKELDAWYGIQPVWAKYKDGYLAEGDENEGRYIPMFVAEDVEEHFPEAVYHVDGLTENWNERIMIPAMFAMLKQQKSEIDSLKQEIQEIKQLVGKE